MPWKKEVADQMLSKELQRCREVEIWRFGNNIDECVIGKDGEEGIRGFRLRMGRTNWTSMRMIVTRTNGIENLRGRIPLPLFRRKKIEEFHHLDM